MAPETRRSCFRAALCVYNHFGDTSQTLTYSKSPGCEAFLAHNIRDTPDFKALQQNPQFKALLDRNVK